MSESILSVLPAGRAPVVLDYGCGEALCAPAVAERTRQLLLFDISQEIRRDLLDRYAGDPAISVVSEQDIAALTAGSVDVIVANSVIQYLDRVAFAGLMTQWRRWLAPGGLLVVADVIPPHTGIAQEATIMLLLGIRHGYLLSALKSLVAMSFSDYRSLRRQLGLSRYTEAEMLAMLGEHGFDARRHTRNFGLNPTRMTFLAIRRHEVLGPGV